MGNILPIAKRRGHYRTHPMEVQPFLRALGRRLREVRQEAGLSVSAVAERAGLSRRYLTDAEAGRANPTVGVLLPLAEALGTDLSRLLDLDAAARRAERVALVGLRGAGKSTVGRALAARMEVPFIELDQRVEELAGLSLAEVFDLHGEARFRELEAEALEGSLASGGERVVLASSGSIVRAEATFHRLRQTCRTVWLRAGAGEHFQRVLDQGDARPMANRPRAREELEALLADREPLYARCELTVDTSGRGVEEVVTEVLARIGP